MYNEKNISRYRKKEMISRALKNRRKGGGGYKSIHNTIPLNGFLTKNTKTSSRDKNCL